MNTSKTLVVTLVLCLAALVAYTHYYKVYEPGEFSGKDEGPSYHHQEQGRIPATP